MRDDRRIAKVRVRTALKTLLLALSLSATAAYSAEAPCGQ